MNALEKMSLAAIEGLLNDIQKSNENCRFFARQHIEKDFMPEFYEKSIAIDTHTGTIRKWIDALNK